jgi:hypothetical protein
LPIFLHARSKTAALQHAPCPAQYSVSGVPSAWGTKHPFFIFFFLKFTAWKVWKLRGMYPVLGSERYIKSSWPVEAASWSERTNEQASRQLSKWLHERTGTSDAFPISGACTATSKGPFHAKREGRKFGSCPLRGYIVNRRKVPDHFVHV